MLHAGNKNTFQAVQEIHNASGAPQNAIDDSLVTCVLGIRKPSLEKRTPLNREQTHDASAEGRRTPWPLRHDVPSALVIIRHEERKLVLVTTAGTDLVASIPGTEADDTQAPSRVTKVINCILTVRSWVFKRESDAVQLASGDARAPDELVNVLHFLLVRFGRQCNQ